MDLVSIASAIMSLSGLQEGLSRWNSLRKEVNDRLDGFGLSVEDVGELEASELRERLVRIDQALAGINEGKDRPKEHGDEDDSNVMPELVKRLTANELGRRKEILLKQLVSRAERNVSRHLKELSTSASPQNLQELVDAQDEVQDLRVKALDAEQVREKQEQQFLVELERQRVELLERRTAAEAASTHSAHERQRLRDARWKTYLERESVATLVGAILLIGLVSVFTIAMFTAVTIPELLANAFLIILGYFFGQASGKVSASTARQPTD